MFHAKERKLLLQIILRSPQYPVATCQKSHRAFLSAIVYIPVELLCRKFMISKLLLQTGLPKELSLPLGLTHSKLAVLFSTPNMCNIVFEVNDAQYHWMVYIYAPDQWIPKTLSKMSRSLIFVEFDLNLWFILFLLSIL